MMMSILPPVSIPLERREPVYERCSARAVLCALALVASLIAAAPMARAQGISAADAAVVDARDALKRKDRSRLAADRATTAAANHPLAMWPDYWELTNRLGEAQQPEVTAFSARWSGSYVEDRLRNDWLLELGILRRLPICCRPLRTNSTPLPSRCARR